MRPVPLLLLIAFASACAAATPPARPNAATAGSPDPGISYFAAWRHGLHGPVVRLPHRGSGASSSPSFLFFVGGPVARAAWIATLGSFERDRIPGVVMSPIVDHGSRIVFEHVADWPRALRVVSARADEHGVDVMVESLAARDQPAGATGRLHIALGDSRVGPTTTVAPRPHCRADCLADVGAARAAFASIALAGDRAPFFEGAGLSETWQGALSRQLAVLDASNQVPFAARLDRLIASLDPAHCGVEGCFDPLGTGLEMRTRDGRVVVTHVFVRGETDPRLAVAPVIPTATLEEIVAADSIAPESLHSDHRPFVQAGVVVGVVRNESGDSWLVESEGNWSSVTALTMNQLGLDTEYADVDGDGRIDVVLRPPQGEWSHHRVFLRGRAIDEPAQRSLALEVLTLGARDVKEALTRAQRSRVEPTSDEGCSVLASLADPTGFTAHTAPDVVVAVHGDQRPYAPLRGPAAREPLQSIAEDACRSGFLACDHGVCHTGDRATSWFVFERLHGRLVVARAVSL